MELNTLLCLWLITLVASFSPAAHTQTFSVIHEFAGPEGANPEAGVTLRAGVFYGTTVFGGSSGEGSVYEITRVGNNWSTVPISLLSGGGNHPTARVVFGPDGHAYGTTQTGGDPNVGIVFNLLPRPTICRTANCFWTENVLYQFEGFNDGETASHGDLVWDQQGNIYGTTYYGGGRGCMGYGCGTVYEMMHSGNTWTEMPIYTFSGPDGAVPEGGVVFDNKGNLFGTTAGGGLYGAGTIFELSHINGKWVETFLYSFQNGEDGSVPFAAPIFDSLSGNLYGVTANGGSGNGGTVFELSPSGDSWIFNLIYTFFQNGNYENAGPTAPLTKDALGNLYGTTGADGAYNQGSVFKLAKMGNVWIYSSLHDFTGGSDGGVPFSNVTLDVNGNLYGTTNLGGQHCSPGTDCGVVWMIMP